MKRHLGWMINVNSLFHIEQSLNPGKGRIIFEHSVQADNLRFGHKCICQLFVQHLFWEPQLQKHLLRNRAAQVSQNPCSSYGSLDTIFCHVIVLCRELLFPVPHGTNPHLLYCLSHQPKKSPITNTFLSLLTCAERLKSPLRLKSLVKCTATGLLNLASLNSSHFGYAKKIPCNLNNLFPLHQLSYFIQTLWLLN